MTPTVLVNHFPLVREPCDVLFYPEFSLWCGTTATADWHTRYNAMCSVYGHLHIPRTTWYDGVRFEEVSVGYPREWRRRKPYRWLRQILPDPQYAPGYLNEFGGHFVITQEMREQSREDPGPAAQPAADERAACGRCCPRSPIWSRAELYDDPPDLAPLPEEEPLIARSVAKRRNEFVTVRHCARVALGELGVPPVPILKGDKGEPCWPDGRRRQPDALRGLSRRGGRPAAATVRSVGIDAEPHGVLPDGVLDAISLPGRALRARRRCRRVCTGTESCSAPRRRRTRRGSR